MKNIPALDGLRGIAIIAVFLHHLQLIPGGFYGVDVFFVLSGFLITSLLLNEFQIKETINLKAFYLRRAFRLFPALVVAILSCFFYELISQPYSPESANKYKFLWGLGYFINWKMALTDSADLAPLGPLWSLAIEEQFYFIWPIAFALLLKSKVPLQVIAAILAIGIIAAITWRITLWRSGSTLWRVYTGTDAHADPILIGCLLSVSSALFKDHWMKLVQFSKAAAPFALIFLLFSFFQFSFGSRLMFHFGFTLVAVLTACLIIAATLAISPAIQGIFEWPVLIWFGKLSYSLYLWNSLAILYIEKTSS